MPALALSSTTAVVCHGARDLRTERRTLWPPAAGEAQIAVRSTGLCGSDLHYFAHGRNGDFRIQSPLVLGHESAGVVTAVGPGVTHLRVGERVAVECGVMCNTCKYCKQGRYNLCKAMRFCSSAKTFPHLDGTLQQRLNHPAHLLHPIPDSLDYEAAALAEPLSVLLHASRRAELSAGQTVCVFGCGAIGLLACALARARGATRIVALDIQPARLAFAKQHNLADDTFCLPTTRPEPRLVNKVLETDAQAALRTSRERIGEALAQFGLSDGVDVVLECSGAEPCIQMSVYAAAAGGKVMLVGMGSPVVTVPLAAAALREVDVLGSFRYANTYREALQLLAHTNPDGGVLPDMRCLITHRFPLVEAKSAFELVQRGMDEKGALVLKVMINNAASEESEGLEDEESLSSDDD